MSEVKKSEINCSFCERWRKEVESDSNMQWKLVPKECEVCVGNYIKNGEYIRDIEKVVGEALKYAESVHVKGDGKDIWIFDIDETSISNVALYEDNHFGTEPLSVLDLLLWYQESQAIPLPTLNLYKRLKELGFKIVFLTGRLNILEFSTTKNLQEAGFNDWEDLILRKPWDLFQTSKEFKSKQRKNVEEKGYRIIGNIGDQWSDIIGDSVGYRTFKIPNPLYYSP